MNHQAIIGVRRVGGLLGPAALLVALLLQPPSFADVLATTDFAEWELATGGATFIEDFNTFVQDTQYRTQVVAVAGFTLQQIGDNPGEFRNLVDVHPFLQNDNNGTPHASNYVNFPEGGSPGTSVVLTMDSATLGFGGELFGAGGAGEGEELNWEIQLRGGGGVVVFEAPADGFFGVYTTENDFFTEVRFVARDLNPGAGGEGFGFDNVVGAVPEPSVLLLLTAGGLLAFRRLR